MNNKDIEKEVIKNIRATPLTRNEVTDLDIKNIIKYWLKFAEENDTSKQLVAIVRQQLKI